MKPSRLMVLFFLLVLAFQIRSQSYSELDVATIMQDPKKWVGSPPNQPFWSEDSKWIYFYWNPEATDADSLYKISAKGGKAIKLAREERRRVPPAHGVYSRNYRFKLFARNNDIFLYDKKRDSMLQITNTSARESNPKFSLDERGVIFQRGMNLFRWDRATGALAQIIDLRKGENPDEKKDAKTDAEKFVKNEELDLIEVVKKRKELHDRTKEAKLAEFPLALKILRGR